MRKVIKAFKTNPTFRFKSIHKPVGNYLQLAYFNKPYNSDKTNQKFTIVEVFFLKQ